MNKRFLLAWLLPFMLAAHLVVKQIVFDSILLLVLSAVVAFLYRHARPA